MESEAATATVQAIEPEQMPSLVFLRDTFRLYHSNMWLFLKLIAPAVVFGYIAVYVGQQRATEVLRNLPRGPEILEYKFELLEMWLCRLASFGVSWLVYCFAFAGISVAVHHLDSGADATAEDSLSYARKRFGPLMRLSISLFLVVAVSFGVSMFCMTYAIGWLRVTNSSVAYLLGAAFAFVAFWVASKFALAIPALILDCHGVVKSFFVSDEMTAGRWGSLAVLLIESIGGSYLAWFLPYWIASLVASRIALPQWSNWGLYAVAIVGSAMLLPNMLVGFSLLYVRTREKSPS